MKNLYIITDGNGKDEIINTDENGLISELERDRVIIASTGRVIKPVYKLRWLDKPPTSIKGKIIELLNVDEQAKLIENFKIVEKLFTLLNYNEQHRLIHKLQIDNLKEIFTLTLKLKEESK